jgi:NAD(P)-dependent dehydrogenase (short-subunit alcohol dehydrogenase family)
VLTDVSKAEQVEALAQATIKEFGAVNLLFNNAGVSVSKPLWEFTLNDWQWVLSVNLWGVIHGIHAFLPLMLNQNEESYLVNTSSVQGLVSVPMTAPYNTSKHGIITLSETLYHELIAANKTNVKVAVVCPGLVSTRAYEAERNRPVEWQNPPREISPEEQQRYQMGRKMLEAGMSPAELANIVFEGLREERFYIMTHPHFKPVIQLRMEDIMQERNPSGMQRG